MTKENVLFAINAVGCLLSALLLFSGILAYPVFSLIFEMPLAALLAVVLGFWFGSYGRFSAGLELAAGNAAVLTGLALVLATYYMFFHGSTDGGPIFFLGGALVIVFGYTVMAGILTRGLFRIWSRSA